MEYNDGKRWTTFSRIYDTAKKKLIRVAVKKRRRRSFNATVLGITCNNAYALPKTTSDLCRQQLMEKRLRSSTFCCQARRMQAAPSQLLQQSMPVSALTGCPNCPSTSTSTRPTRQTRATGAPSLQSDSSEDVSALSRRLPCQALPPPPPCAPPCPPCPPCPPTLSTPLKASDYIHTTTECYSNNAKQDPCRWDNTSCYNEGNDASGNTIRQWNTRCQFASSSSGPNSCVNNATGGRPPAILGSTVNGPGRAVPSSTSDVNVAVSHSLDSSHRVPAMAMAKANGTCPRQPCRSLTTSSDGCFRKCKKQLTVHFPSDKYGGAQHQLGLRNRSAKLTSPITPKPSYTTTTTTTAPPNVAVAVAKDLLVESPISTTTRIPLLTTTATIPLTPITPLSTSAITTLRYGPQISLIDDDMPPVSVSRTQQTANRPSQLGWLKNQRTLYPSTNKRSTIIEAQMTSPPLPQSSALASHVYKNHFDRARVKR